MLDPLKNPTATSLVRARNECRVLECLKNGAKTSSEISTELSLSPRNVKDILTSFKKDELVHRVMLSHTYALIEPYGETA